MKILFYIQRFNKNFGGIEKQSNLLKKYFVERKCNVDVLTYNLPKEYLNSEQIKPENKIISYNVFNLYFFTPILSIIYGVLYLFINIRKYDVIICFLVSSNSVISGILGKFFKVPVITRLGGSRKTGDIGTSKKTFSGKIKLWIIKKTIQKYIVPSDEIKNELTGHGFDKDKIIVINNGVEQDIFTPINSQEKKLKKRNMKFSDLPVILFAGRLHSNKGLDDLINTFIFFSDKIQLIIAGDGEERKRFEVEYFNFKDKIIFTGNVRNIKDYYDIADLFILPSFGEGMSNVLLEAMSCGLICIATDIGGNNEIIKNSYNGFLYNAGNRNELRNLLSKILPDLKQFNNIKINARNTILEKFTFEKSAEKYLSVLKDIPVKKN